MQTVVHGERVSPHYLVHAGTAEPLRVSPPEAVAYLLELRRARIRSSRENRVKMNGPTPCGTHPDNVSTPTRCAVFGHAFRFTHLLCRTTRLTVPYAPLVF